MTDNTHTDNEELRDRLANIQLLTGLDDRMWKEKFGNESGLYGYVQANYTPKGRDKLSSTKSSGELEEILYTFATEIGREALRDNMSAARFEFSAQKAKAAIEALLATQTTKLQAEARINECAKTNAWACTIPAKHALGESGQEAVYDYVDQRIAALEREHKIGEDSE